MISLSIFGEIQEVFKIRQNYCGSVEWGNSSGILTNQRITECSRLRAFGPTRTPPVGGVANTRNVMRYLFDAIIEQIERLLRRGYEN